jgi:precorrin-6B methylase 1
MTKETLSVVVACHGGRPPAAAFHRRLTAAVNAVGMPWHILYVGDPGASGAVPAEASSDTRVELVPVSAGSSRQEAVAAGLRRATGSAVAIIDADPIAPPEVIGPLVDRWREGCDVAYGRPMPGDGDSAAGWGGRVRQSLIDWLADVPPPLHAGDVRILSRRAVEAFNALPEGDRIERGADAWSGLRQAAVPTARERPTAAPAGDRADRVSNADRLRGRILVGLFVVGLVYAIWTATIGWGNTLNDRHSFRQSQTAMTAQFMIGQPFRLAYETPVLGKPWSIPLEFPLYQWLVARLVGLFGTPLDQTGRFVSLVCFLLTTIPIWRIARASGVPAGIAWVPALLFVISPFYIFWGRTFLIELMTTFFGMAFLAATLDSVRNRSWPLWACAVVCGSLCAMVKLTTFAVFLAACGLLAAFQAWREWTTGGSFPDRCRRAGWWLAIPAVPLVAGMVWTVFADGVRAGNPIAAVYLRGARHDEWLFGTWPQKFSLDVWRIITDRFVELIGYPPLAWLLLGAALAITLVVPRRRRETLACFACYLLAPAVFTNLHMVHDYYMNANGVFLIMALGFAIVALLEDARTRRAGWALLALAAFTAVTGHRLLHLPRQTLDNAQVLEAGKYIRSATPEGSVIVCVGQDWSALVCYYARRRALMIPVDRDMAPALVDAALANLKGENVAALVVVEPTAYSPERARQQLAAAGFDVPVLSVKGLPAY